MRRSLATALARNKATTVHEAFTGGNHRAAHTKHRAQKTRAMRAGFKTKRS